MEDGRYRARTWEGHEIGVAATNLVGASPGDVLVDYIVKHPAIEVCLFGGYFEAAITGPVAEGDEAILGLYNLPAGGGAEVDTERTFSVPLEGVETRSSVVVDTNTAEEPGDLNDRPVFYRGDRVRIKVVRAGAVTAQTIRAHFCFREVKHGRQEGPS